MRERATELQCGLCGEPHATETCIHNQPGESFYDILGVRPHAGPATIDAAYGKKMAAIDDESDPYGDPAAVREQANRRALVERAYKVLMDPRQREGYDRFGVVHDKPVRPGAPKRRGVGPAVPEDAKLPEIEVRIGPPKSGEEETTRLTPEQRQKIRFQVEFLGRYHGEIYNCDGRMDLLEERWSSFKHEVTEKFGLLVEFFKRLDERFESEYKERSERMRPDIDTRVHLEKEQYVIPDIGRTLGAFYMQAGISSKEADDILCNTLQAPELVRTEIEAAFQTRQEPVDYPPFFQRLLEHEDGKFFPPEFYDSQTLEELLEVIQRVYDKGRKINWGFFKLKKAKKVGVFLGSLTRLTERRLAYTKAREEFEYDIIEKKFRQLRTEMEQLKRHVHSLAMVVEAAQPPEGIVATRRLYSSPRDFLTHTGGDWPSFERFVDFEANIDKRVREVLES